jgi:YVTN family beta-propeller protein
MVMQSLRRALYVLILIVSFAVLALPVLAQQVIATVPVGAWSSGLAVNPITNKIYVVNECAYTPDNCQGIIGTVTVIDGATDNTQSVNVGYFANSVALNPVTNRIYVVSCGNDEYCGGAGTVSVIDGVSNTVVATVTVGNGPYGVAVNSVTNKIYVTNFCASDPTCRFLTLGTVSVIDGVSNTVTATVTVGARPGFPVVNPVTDKIYVANYCGNDPTCGQPNFVYGTVTVIDGLTNNTQSVNVGVLPTALDINSVTNKIYVVDQCADDPTCFGTGGVTVIDGATLATTDVSLGGYTPNALGVNSVTNKVYVPSGCFGDLSCQGDRYGTVTVIDGVTLATTSTTAEYGPYSVGVNSVTNKIYVANQCGLNANCYLHQGTVTVIDGVSLATVNLDVGRRPNGLVLNSATNRIYVLNQCGNDSSCRSRNGTVSVIDGTPIPPTPLQFVPLSQPCRAVDTRPENGGDGPIPGGTFQDFPISGAPNCGIPASAAAYSLNVTVVPQGSLGYLTIWPAGQPQPVVSTLNSVDGRVKADAAILPAGANGEVSVYVTDTTNVILDIDGYFAPVSGSTLAFYPITPCRVADTRVDTFPTGLGPPQLFALTPRDFPVLNSPCIPSGINPAAYSFNFTVVPGHPVGYLTVWPTGQSQPVVSTLNDQTGTIVANAAIVPAGTAGDISVYSTHDTQLLIDIDGYFAPAGPGGLSLYGVQPCRVIDTRQLGPPFSGTLSPPVDVVDSPCGLLADAQAYVFNATVVPTGALGYLTLWPDGTGQPVVSTLNAFDGALTNNMAIVPTNNGNVDAFANGLTQLILDISSYFAP